jgi:hypothetical protein
LASNGRAVGGQGLVGNGRKPGVVLGFCFAATQPTDYRNHVPAQALQLASNPHIASIHKGDAESPTFDIRRPAFKN